MQPIDPSRPAPVAARRRAAATGLLPGAVALALALAAVALPAQDLEPTELADERPTPSYSIPRVEVGPTVDGVMDEPAWEQALVFELDFETRPGENVPPPVRTECRMLHSDTHLYYGCRAWDPDPQEIRARYSDRDNAVSDDTVGLAIDPFLDHNTAFILDVNPLGIQNDRIYVEASGFADESWDAIWDSAGRLTDFGYEVEAAIPFSSLRFPRSPDPQTWGFNFRRYQPRGATRRIALVPYDRNDRCRTCQHAHLVGFAGVDPGRNLEITPTLTSVQTASRDGFPDGPLVRADPDVDPGLTINWGITPNLALGATLNPDFSQVEADVAQLDINREFALFFPERRPFFLEGSDYFSTQLRAVYTRTLADPDWGVKLTGKEGRHAIGVFAVRDDVTSLLLPGPESSSLDSIADGSEAAVLRYRRDVGESSTLGALYTDRRASGYHNRVAGLDGRLRLTTHDVVNFQWLRSSTEYPTAIADDHGLAPGSLEDDALTVNYRHSRRNYTLRASWDDIGTDFRADLGFMPRVGFRRLIAGGNYEWFGDDDRWYTSIEFGGDWDRTETQDGALLEEESEFFAGFVGRRQLVFFFGGGVRDRVFREVPFDQQFGWIFASIQPTGDLEIGVNIDRRDAIDIREVRAGEQESLNPYIEWRPGRRLQANLAHTYRNFEIAGVRLFRADQSELRLVYQFNRRTFVRLIGQLTDVVRNPDLFTDEIEPRVEDAFGQFLFSYKINPQTAVFVGYSSSYLDLAGSGLTETGNTIFFKVGYNWQP